jgi:peptide/nickel transport system substrate-binding protein
MSQRSIILSLLLILGVVLSACGGAATTAAPAATAEAPAATEAPEEPEVEPTEAPAPTAEAPTAEAEATEPSAALEFTGVPQIITDLALFPTEYQEAPMLAEMVAAGDLPPVAERLPAEPLVIHPAFEIGQYGGTWRAGFTGPGDRQNAERITADHMLFWDAEVNNVVPNIAKAWEVTDDGRTVTLTLREGMKWSDGAPFTADDILFWYEDVYLNEELTPAPAAFMSIGGQQGTVEKVDDVTVQFKFAEPYYGFIEYIASLSGGCSFHGGVTTMGLCRPKHYLSQFHPSYTSQEEIDAMVEAEGFETWVELFRFKQDPQLNMEAPVTSIWKPVTPITSPQFVLERNPYYFAVDTAGNQLPYIDRLELNLAENLEVLNLRAVAAEYDFQVRHIGLANVPVLLENAEAGNYNVRFWYWQHGCDACINFNQNYDGDPEVQQWLRNRDFRIALSISIDREQLNEAFWLGQGSPGSAAPGPLSPYYLGDESRTQNAEFDPDRANEILDGLGLTERDSDGFRMRTDGQGRLTLHMTTVGAQFVPYTQIMEAVVAGWAEHIGIAVELEELERTLEGTRVSNNELQLAVWENSGSDNPILNCAHTTACYQFTRWAPLNGLWYATNGEQGLEPEGDIARQQELLDQALRVAPEERLEIGREILRIYVDNVWAIGTVGVSPAVIGTAVVSNSLGNVPEFVPGNTPGQTPGNARPATWYFMEN